MTSPCTQGPFIDPREMRSVMGAFCSGVVVVTAVIDHTPVGFTCQSFASLSLDPPLVMFAPGKSSKTWPTIRNHGRFCVNVLSEGHETLSDQFAVSGADKFVGVQWAMSPSGSPKLTGVAAWVDCTLWNELDGGDHTIVLGNVTAMGADLERDPLLYHRGRYRAAAPIP